MEVGTPLPPSLLPSALEREQRHPSVGHTVGGILLLR